jgi:hypothetical protein
LTTSGCSSPGLSPGPSPPEESLALVELGAELLRLLPGLSQLGRQPFDCLLGLPNLLLPPLGPLAFALQVVRQTPALLLQNAPRPFCDLQPDPEPTSQVFLTPSPSDLASSWPWSMYMRMVLGVTRRARAATAVVTHPEASPIISVSSPRTSLSSTGGILPTVLSMHYGPAGAW